MYKFWKKTEVNQPKTLNNELKYGRFTVQTYAQDGKPISVSIFISNQKTFKIVRNALNEIDGNSSGKDGIYSYFYEPGEYRIDIGNISL